MSCASESGFSNSIYIFCRPLKLNSYDCSIREKINLHPGLQLRCWQCCGYLASSPQWQYVLRMTESCLLCQHLTLVVENNLQFILQLSTSAPEHSAFVPRQSTADSHFQWNNFVIYTKYNWSNNATLVLQSHINNAIMSYHTDHSQPPELLTGLKVSKALVSGRPLVSNHVVTRMIKELQGVAVGRAEHCVATTTSLGWLALEESACWGSRAHSFPDEDTSHPWHSHSNLKV